MNSSYREICDFDMKPYLGFSTALVVWPEKLIKNKTIPTNTGRLKRIKHFKQKIQDTELNKKFDELPIYREFDHKPM